MQNQKTGKKIILLDSINTIDKIKKEVTNLTDVRIITFDYISHKNLLKNNITHEISDDFLDEKDIQLIQNESLNLTKWYDNELKDVLNYEEINLGRTFYVEFHQYLLQILKKILELKKITKELSNMELIVSPGLFQIAKEFHSSLRQLNIKIEKSESFLNDSIKFRLTNTVKFDISKKSYQKLKKSSEKIFSNITSNEMKDGVESILFIEFDPIKYRKLFEISKNYSLNLILFNRRRPSIWNLKSYKIIKNSSYIIADNIIDQETENIIQNEQKKIMVKIENLWNNEKIFESHFIFDGIPFWKIIKNDFLKLCSNRIKEAISEINITKRVFEKFKISSIVCWSENGFNEQIAIGLSQKMKKSIFLLQHGLYTDSTDSVYQNEFSGVLPRNSDNFFTWGDITKQYVRDIGIPETKIEIIGSPSYDTIFDESEIGDDQKHILIATTSTSNKIGDFLIKDKENFEKTIVSICKTLKKMGKEIVIKIHPFEEEEYVTELVRKLNSKINIIKKGNIIPLIKNCEVFIALDMSTTILEAQLLKKPVISINTQKIPYNDGSSVFESNSCDRVKIEDFQKTMEKILYDENYRKKLIERGTNFLNRYVSNQGSASKKLLSYFEEF
tara:strand:- start:8961 stop:10808 length:1848 start_codon:yes stop_codon:yes gene_type:complete